MASPRQLTADYTDDADKGTSVAKPSTSAKPSADRMEGRQSRADDRSGLRRPSRITMDPGSETPCRFDRVGIQPKSRQVAKLRAEAGGRRPDAAERTRKPMQCAPARSAERSNAPTTSRLAGSKLAHSSATLDWYPRNPRNPRLKRIGLGFKREAPRSTRRILCPEIPEEDRVRCTVCAQSI
jgi:hypothetical protein